MPTPRTPDESSPPRTGSGCPDTDHSLKVGTSGPTLLEDFRLREKITRFDH
jgi:catalase